MSMEPQIGLKNKLFDLSEASELLILVQSITQKHQVQLQPVQDRLNRILSNDPRRPMVEADYQEIVSRWKFKIEQLGATVCGLWMVNFEVPGGALSWRHPELTLSYFIVKDTNFSERIKLTTYIEEHDPDWSH